MYSPLFVVNAREISVHDCIVRTEIQRTQIRSYSSVTNDNSGMIHPSISRISLHSGEKTPNEWKDLNVDNAK